MTSNFPRASRDPLKAIRMFLKPFLMDSAVKPMFQTPGTGINKILPSFSFFIYFFFGEQLLYNIVLVSAVQ